MVQKETFSLDGLQRVCEAKPQSSRGGSFSGETAKLENGGPSSEARLETLDGRRRGDGNFPKCTAAAAFSERKPPWGLANLHESLPLQDWPWSNEVNRSLVPQGHCHEPFGKRIVVPVSAPALFCPCGGAWLQFNWLRPCLEPTRFPQKRARGLTDPFIDKPAHDKPATHVIQPHIHYVAQGYGFPTSFDAPNLSLLRSYPDITKQSARSANPHFIHRPSHSLPTQQWRTFWPLSSALSLTRSTAHSTL